MNAAVVWRIEYQRSVVRGKRLSSGSRKGEDQEVKKKEEKMGIVRGNFSGTELPSRVPGNDPPQAFSALYAIGKRALPAHFGAWDRILCCGSFLLLG